MFKITELPESSHALNIMYRGLKGQKYIELLNMYMSPKEAVVTFKDTRDGQKYEAKISQLLTPYED